MKRIICLALCALAALLACACEDSGNKSPTEAQTQAVTEKATEAPATADSPNPSSGNGRRGLKSFVERFDTSVTVDEKIVYKDADLEVKTLCLDYSSASGPELRLSFKNNYGKDITVQAPYTVVNGFMVKPDMSVEIPYAKQGEGTLSLPYYNLSLADITCLENIEFSLKIVETGSYNPVSETELISVRTSADSGEAPEYNESGTTAYDSKDIKIVLKGMNSYSTAADGAEFVVYMYNGTDRTIAIQTGDVTVNGYDMTSVMNRSVLPGKRAVDAVTIYAQDLDEHSIDEIDNIKVSFVIKDADTWEDIASTELISAPLNAASTHDEAKGASSAAKQK